MSLSFPYLLIDQLVKMHVRNLCKILVVIKEQNIQLVYPQAELHEMWACYCLHVMIKCKCNFHLPASLLPILIVKSTICLQALPWQPKDETNFVYLSPIFFTENQLFLGTISLNSFYFIHFPNKLNLVPLTLKRIVSPW